MTYHLHRHLHQCWSCSPVQPRLWLPTLWKVSWSENCSAQADPGEGSRREERRQQSGISQVEFHIFSGLGCGISPWYTEAAAHQEESGVPLYMEGCCSPLWQRSALEPALCPAWRTPRSAHFPLNFIRKILITNREPCKINSICTASEHNLKNIIHNILWHLEALERTAWFKESS